MKKKNVTISLSHEAIEKIKKIAQQERRSVSGMIEVLIIQSYTHSN